MITYKKQLIDLAKNMNVDANTLDQMIAKIRIISDMTYSQSYGRPSPKDVNKELTTLHNALTSLSPYTRNLLKMALDVGEFKDGRNALTAIEAIIDKPYVRQVYDQTYQIGEFAYACFKELGVPWHASDTSHAVVFLQIIQDNCGHQFDALRLARRIAKNKSPTSF